MTKDMIKGWFLGGLLIYNHYFLKMTNKGLLYVGILLLICSVLLPLLRLANKHKRFSRIQLSTIDGMDGHEFEEYTAFMLRQMGFSKVVVTKAVGDQGIDVIALKDGLKYGFQCKRWKSNVGNKAVQEVFAGQAFYSLDRAIVLTNSSFTVSAQRLAQKLTVELWGREELTRILEKPHREKLCNSELSKGEPKEGEIIARAIEEEIREKTQPSVEQERSSLGSAKAVNREEQVPINSHEKKRKRRRKRREMSE